MQNLRQFVQSMENNPKLLPSTVNTYKKAVRELILKYGTDPTIEQLNHFIAVKCRKRQTHVKYAIKEYLKFRDREKDYSLLVKAKVRQPIKQKIFLSREQIKDIIDSIDNKMHKTIAILQTSSGARASEILTIEKRRVNKEKYEDKQGIERERIRILVKGKGDRPRNLYFKIDYWHLIEPHYNKVKILRKYLFLNEEELTYLNFWTKVETAYKRYLESLQEAAKKCGLKIGTHDLRRSFANIVRLDTGDISKAQKALGHSDIRTTMRYFSNEPEEVADTMLQHQTDF